MTEETKLLDTEIQNYEHDGNEMELTAKEELENLISRLNSSTASDKLYQILVTIRSQYSNVESSSFPGKNKKFGPSMLKYSALIRVLVHSTTPSPSVVSNYVIGIVNFLYFRSIFDA